MRSKCPPIHRVSSLHSASQTFRFRMIYCQLDYGSRSVSLPAEPTVGAHQRQKDDLMLDRRLRLTTTRPFPVLTSVRAGRSVLNHLRTLCKPSRQSMWQEADSVFVVPAALAAALLHLLGAVGGYFSQSVSLSHPSSYSSGPVVTAAETAGGCHDRALALFDHSSGQDRVSDRGCLSLHPGKIYTVLVHSYISGVVHIHHLMDASGHVESNGLDTAQGIRLHLVYII